MRHVRFAALAAVTVIGFAAAASAADLPVKAPVRQTAAPVRWTGFYIGANAGAMWNKVDGFFTNFPDFSWNTTQTTGLAGIHGGYQYQFGNIVVGLEGGWSGQLGNAFGSRDGGGQGAPCSIDAPRSCQSRIDNILQFGPRLGWAMERWLAYGTGGFARATISTKTVDNSSEFTVTEAGHRHNGWFAGGGLDYLVTNNFILGVDYRHYEFRSQNYIDSVFGDFDRTLKASADTVTARLTVKTGN